MYNSSSFQIKSTIIYKIIYYYGSLRSLVSSMSAYQTIKQGSSPMPDIKIKYKKLFLRQFSFNRFLVKTLRVMMFSFLPKNAIVCLFLKNVSPSKWMICFILNNLHIPMVGGIVFYARYKSRVLIIPCKADDCCLFIKLPDKI